MQSLVNMNPSDPSSARKISRCRARSARLPLCIAAASAFGLPLMAGCDEETARREFIAASTAGLETGVRAIVGGMIDGTFAVVDIATADDSSGGPDGTIADNTGATAGDSAAARR